MEGVVRFLDVQDSYVLSVLESVTQVTPWSAAQLRESFEGGAVGLGVEESSRDLCSYCLVKPIFETADILTFGVHPDYQGQGKAKQLLDVLKQWAVDQLVETLFLEVRVSNHRAVHVYEQAGFKTLHRRENYYNVPHLGGREDAWIMAWTH
jgi:[ribosomal protein S18]-alanine N-acetyltransferase